MTNEAYDEYEELEMLRRLAKRELAAVQRYHDAMCSIAAAFAVGVMAAATRAGQAGRGASRGRDHTGRAARALSTVLNLDRVPHGQRGPAARLPGRARLKILARAALERGLAQNEAQQWRRQ